MDFEVAAFLAGVLNLLATVKEDLFQAGGPLHFFFKSFLQIKTRGVRQKGFCPAACLLHCLYRDAVILSPTASAKRASNSETLISEERALRISKAYQLPS